MARPSRAQAPPSKQDGRAPNHKVLRPAFTQATQTATAVSARAPDDPHKGRQTAPTGRTHPIIRVIVVEEQ